MSIINKLNDNKMLATFIAGIVIGTIIGVSSTLYITTDARAMYQASQIIQQAKNEKVQAEQKVSEAQKTIEQATADLQGFLTEM